MTIAGRAFLTFALSLSFLLNGTIIVCAGADGHTAVESLLGHCAEERGTAATWSARERDESDGRLATGGAVPVCVDTPLPAAAARLLAKKRSGLSATPVADCLSSVFSTIERPGGVALEFADRPAPVLGLLGSVVLRT